MSVERGREREVVQPMHTSSVLARNLFKEVHDEIHNIKKPLKPCLLKYFKWWVNHRRQRAGKGFKPVHK